MMTTTKKTLKMKTQKSVELIKRVRMKPINSKHENNKLG